MLGLIEQPIFLKRLDGFHSRSKPLLSLLQSHRHIYIFSKRQVNDHPASIGMTLDQHFSTVIFVTFLNLNYPCRSAVIQIPEHGVWPPKRVYRGRKLPPNQNLTSAASHSMTPKYQNTYIHKFGRKLRKGFTINFEQLGFYTR